VHRFQSYCIVVAIIKPQSPVNNTLKTTGDSVVRNGRLYSGPRFNVSILSSIITIIVRKNSAVEGKSRRPRPARRQYTADAPWW
jgi:hypothetical protein